MRGCLKSGRGQEGEKVRVIETGSGKTTKLPLHRDKRRRKEYMEVSLRYGVLRPKRPKFYKEV